VIRKLRSRREFNISLRVHRIGIRVVSVPGARLKLLRWVEVVPVVLPLSLDVVRHIRRWGEVCAGAKYRLVHLDKVAFCDFRSLCHCFYSVSFYFD